MGALIYMYNFNKPIGILLHFIYSIFTKIRNKIEITVTKIGVPVDQF